ncbi:MAG: DHA2 family efflux MFS transporter permease subunit [Alphaproteobacteria bacterium]|nr:DHA2 family efflux MFS transporter permease subunit [Alphaproteobacteria bacterium]
MTADAIAPPDHTPFRRAMILATITLSQTLYGMTFLMVTVVLPQMQGSLSATQDQISWVVTLNILATAIMTPMSGWLSARFGWRNVTLVCLTGFTVSTVLCGMAESLEALLIYRVLQGGFGAPMTPIGNAILLDVYPKRQHGTVTAIFGMGVVVGPILGPIFGGVLAEIYDWRWIFWLIVPISAVSLAGLWVYLVDGGRERENRFDWMGFLSLSLAVTCLQLMLDRGQREDWFDSTEIILEAAIGSLAFYIFIVHSLTVRRPFLNPRHLLDRNYSLGLIIVFIYGMLNFTPMVLLPPMLKDLMDYPDSIIGFLIACRGAGAIVGFFVAMWVGKLDPRVGMTFGFSILGISGILMMRFDVNVTNFEIAVTSVMQGLAVGLIWVPLVVATFATLDRRFLSESTGVFHLLRNLGSSIFISASVTTLIRTGQINHARLTEFISPFNEQLAFPNLPSVWDVESLSGLAAMGGEIGRQAAMIGYLNAFGLFTLASLIVLPLILFVRVPNRTDA